MTICLQLDFRGVAPRRVAQQFTNCKSVPIFNNRLGPNKIKTTGPFASTTLFFMFKFTVLNNDREIIKQVL